MIRPTLALAALSLLLGGCAGAVTSGGTGRPVTAGMRPATNDHRGAGSGAGAGPVVAATGNAGDLVGRDRAALIALFGQPRLDMQEGAGTKLQFSSERCVLDAYLYPARAGQAAVVTHVDARTPEGEDVDRAGCIQALRRR